MGVTVDASGNLYIADTFNGRVRKVSANGTITTFAGNGVSGTPVNGTAATSSPIGTVYALAFDSKGNVFAACGGYVFKIDSNGILSNFAGNPNAGSANIGDGGKAISAYIGAEGIAVGTDGSVYIADTQNFRVRKVTPDGIINTVAGSGNNGSTGDGGPATSATLSFPQCVALDSAGNIYIADTQNNRIRKVGTNGVINTIAGTGAPSFSGDGGYATGAQLDFPTSLAVDSAGNVYVADSKNSAIRLLQPAAALPLPAVNAGGTVDGAGFSATVAPGGIASVFGTSLATDTVHAPVVPLSANLAGSSITIGGKVAPLFYVSPTQINFQIPWDAATGSATMAGNGPAGTGASQTVTIKAAAPGIFTADSSGKGQGAVTNAVSGLPAVAATPVARGQYITIYCSGLGAVQNTPASGAPPAPYELTSTTATPTVTVGGVASSMVQFSGLAPGFVGLYQVNALVPQTVQPGLAVPLTVAISGATSNTVTIAVQ